MTKEERKEYNREYFKRNSEKILKQNKEYYENNKERLNKEAHKYYNDNKEKILKQKKEYNKINKDIISIKYKKNHDEYYQRNKEKIKEMRKKYNKENKEEIKKKRNIYIENNKEKISQQKKLYKKENKEKIKEIEKLRRINNKYLYLWRSILGTSLKYLKTKKENKTIELLGYSALELKIHLKKLFKDGMTWNNNGEWHVDHIRPIVSFSKDTLPSIVNALSNLQPLWAYENLSKGNKYIQNN
jgi:hypothetical protein